MNATVMCKKCGKPLGMFDGKICYECEKKAHEDFKRYCTENNYVPLTTEMYSQAIKTMDALEQIRAEIEQERVGYPPSADEYKTINKVLQIIDKYKEQTE